MYKIFFYILIAGLVSCSGGKEKLAENAAQVANNAKTANTTKQPLLAKANSPQNAQLTPQQAQAKKQLQQGQVKQQAQARQQANAPSVAPKPVDQGDYQPKNKGWHVSLEKAFNESQKTGKPIMANFTGSDWCGWCKKLDRTVFHQPGFDKWAKSNVVLLELDFPRRFRVPDDIAAQNRSLQQTFGVRGYPTVWLFDLNKDAEGKYNIQGLGKTGFTKTLDEFKTVMGKYMSARKVG